MKNNLDKISELSLLLDISRILDRSMDLRDVMKPVLKSLSKHLSMERATVTLIEENGEIFIDEAHGLTPGQRKRGRYRFGEGVIGNVVKTKKPVAIPRISREPLFLDRTGARKGLRKEELSFLCVPIMMEAVVIGTLSADQPYDESVPLNEELRVMSIIASLISQAVYLRQSLQREQKRLLAENTRLQQELTDRFRPSNIIGNSKEMRLVYDQIAQVSRSTTTVLILGESGTGKELVARAIHYNSPRAQKPFITVNCAALPESLIESELFGHEKGSFTGALAQHKGRFELAEGGTLFLDEIGDLSLTAQVKLLRVLQEHEFERVGGSTTQRSQLSLVRSRYSSVSERTSLWRAPE